MSKPQLSTPRALWESVRPIQWTKNLFLFAGILFSQNLFEPDLLIRVGMAFGLFCLLSGGIYLFNDLVDLTDDRQHPAKSKRPLAAGKLSASIARQAASLLVLLSLGCAYFLHPGFFIAAVGYFVLQMGYIFFLKRQVILDVFAIAGGFALRVLAGAVVINVEISSWFLICTIFLSLFIASAKRRQEIMVEHSGTRKVLGEYSPEFLNQMISVTAAATVVAYALYTLSMETVIRFGDRGLVWTLPFVLFGVLRYLYLIHQKGIGEKPELALLTDKPLLATSLLWAAAAAVVIYG